MLTWHSQSRRLLGVTLAVLLSVLCPAPLNADEDDLGIFVMKVDTGEEHKVARIKGFAKHWTPRWNHAGTQLAFSVNGDQNNSSKIYLVNPDGSKLKEIGEGSAPDWSPDDQQLIVQVTTGNVRPGLWLHDLADGSRVWVNDGTCPRWSPDGNQIAYRSGNGIRYLDLRTNEDRLLIDGNKYRVMDGFEWAHNSTQLGFFARRPQDATNGLYLVDVDAVLPRVGMRYTREGFFGGHHSWSPDDKQIAFTIESFIHVINVAGKQPPRRLPGQPHKSRDPNWSPDGKSIAFARRQFP